MLQFIIKKMKRIILLFLPFSYVLNTMNQCDGSRDQDQDTCPSIDIEYEDFFLL